MVKRVGEAYIGGYIRPEFIHTDMEAKLMKWQRKMAAAAYEQLGSNGYKPSISLKHILDTGFIYGQIAVEKPWAVYVIHDGVRKRKRFASLHGAIEFHKTIYKRHPDSGIVSLGRAYGLPAEWRFKKDKLPKRFKWCPRCVTFRVYKRVDPPVRFSANIKTWNDEKQKFTWHERQIWLTECQLCGHTNRDLAFRSANVPYELRKLKSGARLRTKQRSVKGK